MNDLAEQEPLASRRLGPKRKSIGAERIANQQNAAGPHHRGSEAVPLGPRGVVPLGRAAKVRVGID